MFCKMYECMLKRENSKLSVLVRMNQDDCRMYTRTNFKTNMCKMEYLRNRIVAEMEIKKIDLFLIRMK